MRGPAFHREAKRCRDMLASEDHQLLECTVRETLIDLYRAEMSDQAYPGHPVDGRGTALTEEDVRHALMIRELCGLAGQPSLESRIFHPSSSASNVSAALLEKRVAARTRPASAAACSPLLNLTLNPRLSSPVSSPGPTARADSPCIRGKCQIVRCFVRAHQRAGREGDAGRRESFKWGLRLLIRQPWPPSSWMLTRSSHVCAGPRQIHQLPPPPPTSAPPSRHASAPSTPHSSPHIPPLSLRGLPGAGPAATGGLGSGGGLPGGGGGSTVGESGGMQSLWKYVPKLPPGKKLLHKSSELGQFLRVSPRILLLSRYADFYPQKPDQEEDRLTEANVKSGFVDKPLLQNEGLSAYDLIYEKILDPKTLGRLSDLAGEILSERGSEQNLPALSVFKVPQRQVVQDRDMWISDLAGTESLRVLADSVPHGIKGDRLLDALFQKRVPFTRALWFIKVVGLGEMHAIRSLRPTEAHPSEPPEWTNTITQYLRRQLADLDTAPPSRHQHHRHRSAEPKQPWTLPSERDAFVLAVAIIRGSGDTSFAAHTYPPHGHSIQLSKLLYAEGLLDQRHFLKWSLDQLTNANFEQTTVVLPIVSAFMEEYSRSRALMRYLIDACLLKIKRGQNTFRLTLTTAKLKQYRSASDSAEYQYMNLVYLVQYAIVSASDVAVAPKLWTASADIVREVMATPPPASMPQEVRSIVERALETLGTSVRVRNQTLLNELETPESGRGEWIEILDTLTPETGLDPLLPHLAARRDVPALIDCLCDWATTPHRKGLHRVYVTGRALALLVRPDPKGNSKEELSGSLNDPVGKGKASVREPKADAAGNSIGGVHLARMQEILIGILERGREGEGESANGEYHRRLCCLFGELVHLNIFSVAQFMHRLISRGELEKGRRDEPRAQHYLKLIEALPIDDAQQHLVNHRRVILHGIAENSQPPPAVETVHAAISAHVPHVFAASPISSAIAPRRDSPEDYPLARLDIPFLTLLETSLPRFWQVRVTDWVRTCVQSFVVDQNVDNWRTMVAPGSSLLNARQYTSLVRILEALQDLRVLLDMSLWLILKTTERSLYYAILDVLRRHRFAFFGMGAERDIFEALMTKSYLSKWFGTKHKELREKTTNIHRGLLAYLSGLAEVPAAGATEEDRALLDKDSKAPPAKVRFVLMLSPASKKIPDDFTDIRTLKSERDSIAQAVSNLAYEYLHSKEAMKRLVVVLFEA
ncbi:hypothetical protein BDK51DRAFT_46789 [Blyttiomyces helicus]|uniref:Mediator of RNA polymerase II transcription subunit 12 n=1 Tax=Blyttiomyces helicus TaxID=388810 RepID=A0A4P9WF08_9FUNG|nr:hypothetical protein BDK51DRAFT_46789 [Blyttiomyces helicus]|eukprot:RKO89590.1 hypothetical protein BDK51DRAFT_46789 [Blyttiomyces helicus]